MKRRVAVTLELLESREHFSVATLDATFGSGGRVTDALASPATAIAIEPDGTILAASSASSIYCFYGDEDTPVFPAALLRYDATGHRLGSVARNAQARWPDNTVQLSVQRDGKIFACSEAAGITLGRYDADGTVDTTFGANGRTSVSIGWDFGARSAVLRDGRILATDFDLVIDRWGGTWNVCRFNSDGSLDQTFGRGGLVSLRVDRVRSPFGYFAGVKMSLAQASNGDVIAAAGGISGSLMVLRFDASGRVLSSRAICIGNVMISTTIALPDGGMWIAGSVGSRSQVTPIVGRLTAAGTMDRSFGVRGWAQLKSFTPGSSGEITQILPQVDGGAIVAGDLNMGSDAYVLVGRVSKNGVFAANDRPAGATLTYVGQSHSEPVGAYVYSAVLDGNHRLLLAGSDSRHRLMLLRYKL